MSLKQFGTKLLTMHIFHQKETRSIHQNIIMVVFFRDIFWLWAESKKIFPKELPGDPVLLEIKIYPRDFF